MGATPRKVKIMSDDAIKLIKLVSGEEVVCKVVSDQDLTLIVTECILVGFQTDPNTGKTGIAVYPWCPSAKFPLDIDKDKIMFVADAADGAIAAHKQAFTRIQTLGPTTGLTLPRR